MQGQDNLATAHPIYMVQERRRIYGMDPDYCEVVCWCRHDEFYEVTDPVEMEEIEEEYERTGRQPDQYIRTAYIDVWENVQPFFSRIGAEQYIEANRHNLTDPRVFVESAYRNDEWQAVREMLEDYEDEEPDADWECPYCGAWYVSPDYCSCVDEHADD